MNDAMSLELPPTSWTLLGAAAGQGPDAAQAHEAFVRRYYEPVLAYLAALCGTRDGAEDLAQAFFASRILQGTVLQRAERSRGSFRCYLKRAVRNFFLDSVRHDRRLKRGGDAAVLPIESAGDLVDPDAASQPDRAFHSAWVRSLLRAALEHVQDECAAHGQSSHFDIFVARYLSEANDPPSWAALGSAHGLDEKATRGRAETVARRFRRVLRDLLRVELGSSMAVDEELVIMQALLAGGEP